MKLLLFALLAVLITRIPAYAAVYITGKTLDSGDIDERYSQLPPYLRYPNDAISAIMFKDAMKEVVNEHCNYRFMLYTEIADMTPVVELQTDFERDEIHYYYKEGSSPPMFTENSKPWYSIHTMKHESVMRNSVSTWVEKGDHFSFMMGFYDSALRVPQPLRGQEFKDVRMYYIEQNELYNQLHGFDESHLYARIFYLGEQAYKKFILVAKKDDWSWRVEVNIPSKSEEIEPPDFVPAGQTFGKFYPVK